VAAVFVLSELERKRGGLMGKQESMLYILKVGYPLWFIVREGFSYVFDGLNNASYCWSYYEDFQAAFKLEDVRVSFRIREEYVKFLVNTQKFSKMQNSKELICKGLLVDTVLFEELKSYCREASESYDQYMSLFLPVLEETELVTVVKQIEALQVLFREGTTKLLELSELISKTTSRHIEGLIFESKATVEEVEAKIKAQREIINPKVEKLTCNYKKQVERLEKNIGKEKQPIEKQKSRIEKAIKQTEINMERYNKQLRTQMQKGNKRSEANLKKKLRKEKQKLEEQQKQQKKIETQLKELLAQGTENSLRLKDAFDREVQVERQPIVTLEVFRDERQEFFKQESFKLEKLTQTALEELCQLVEERKKVLANMNMLCFKSNTELKNNTLGYVPFYITVYGTTDPKDRRYFVFSPALISNLGFSSKLKGMLGRAKIKDLFNERFRAIPDLGEKLRLKIASDRDFEAQMETLAQKSNILNMKTLLRDGLLTLKEESWLSESEYQTIFSNI